MSQTLLSHFVKIGYVDDKLALEQCLFDPSMLEKIVFRIGDMIHGMEFDLILAKSRKEVAIAAFLAVSERVQWKIFSQDRHLNGYRNAILISLECKKNAKTEMNIIKQTQGKIATIIYLVNTGEKDTKEIFQDIGIRSFSLTTLHSIQEFKKGKAKSSIVKTQ